MTAVRIAARWTWVCFTEIWNGFKAACYEAPWLLAVGASVLAMVAIGEAGCEQ